MFPSYNNTQTFHYLAINMKHTFWHGKSVLENYVDAYVSNNPKLNHNFNVTRHT